jgi:hypothetical protein
LRKSPRTISPGNSPTSLQPPFRPTLSLSSPADPGAVRTPRDHRREATPSLLYFPPRLEALVGLPTTNPSPGSPKLRILDLKSILLAGTSVKVVSGEADGAKPRVRQHGVAEEGEQGLCGGVGLPAGRTLASFLSAGRPPLLHAPPPLERKLCQARSASPSSHQQGLRGLVRGCRSWRQRRTTEFRTTMGSSTACCSQQASWTSAASESPMWPVGDSPAPVT